MLWATISLSRTLRQYTAGNTKFRWRDRQYKEQTRIFLNGWMAFSSPLKHLYVLDLLNHRSVSFSQEKDARLEGSLYPVMECEMDTDQLSVALATENHCLYSVEIALSTFWTETHKDNLQQLGRRRCMLVKLYESP